MTVIVLVADGARPDTVRRAMDAGALPALARLRDEGGSFSVTTCAPSVTGPAYAPLLIGRFPATVGLPGLRWYDRSRRACRLPGHARSYVGAEMRWVDSDLDRHSPTMFELAPSSIGALSVIRRGLARSARIGSGAVFAARTALTHFRGDIRGWLAIDREIAAEFANRVTTERPAFAFAALTGTDKTSHWAGHDAPVVVEAIAIVDRLVATLRHAFERARDWETTHLWVVSDHGHSPVREHEDLVGLLRDWGHRPRSHPWAYTPRGDVAVMVSGNAMAHLYLDLISRGRRWWPALAARGEPLVSQLLARESVDLIALAHSPHEIEIRARGRGSAFLSTDNGVYSYEPRNGDPLGIGRVSRADHRQAYEATIASEYPDALVQIAALATPPRSGDVILSSARGWDLRARYEPIHHVSSHGALHRDHMLVPLLLNHPPRTMPRRTADVFASAVTALGIPPPPALDGESYI